MGVRCGGPGFDSREDQFGANFSLAWILPWGYFRRSGVHNREFPSLRQANLLQDFSNRLLNVQQQGDCYQLWLLIGITDVNRKRIARLVHLQFKCRNYRHSQLNGNQWYTPTKKPKSKQETNMLEWVFIICSPQMKLKKQDIHVCILR